MSYWASYDGSMKTIDLEGAAEIIRLAKDYGINAECVNENVFLYGNENYNDSGWENFLSETKPYVSSGEICFIGEDDGSWRFRFITSNWYEENGFIKYDEKNARLVGQ